MKKKKTIENCHTRDSFLLKLSPYSKKLWFFVNYYYSFTETRGVICDVTQSLSRSYCASTAFECVVYHFAEFTQRSKGDVHVTVAAIFAFSLSFFCVHERLLRVFALILARCHLNHKNVNNWCGAIANDIVFTNLMKLLMDDNVKSSICEKY